MKVGQQPLVVGFSLSPGGLLLPYHLGALGALKHRGHIGGGTPLAGASAGSIAATSVAADINLRRILDATVDVCNHCVEQGGARGNLLPLLRRHLSEQIREEQFVNVLCRQGKVVIAYKELFPRFRNVLQTEFHDRNDLMNAVCHSSMFPFFTSNFPASLDLSNGIHSPRVVVDGAFTALDRIGIPEFADAGVHVDRTVRISVLPRNLVGENCCGPREDCISPHWEGAYQLGRLTRLAIHGSHKQELFSLYESGWNDAERWCREERAREKNAVQTMNGTPSSLN
jgi:hypothetical protein